MSFAAPKKWVADFSFDTSAIFVGLGVALCFQGFWIGLFCGLLITLSLFNQFNHLHEASHVAGHRGQKFAKLVGWFTGILLLFPFSLWREHHLLHHAHAHLNDRDNAFHPLRSNAGRIFEVIIFSLRTVLIGVSLPMTALLCIFDHLASVQKSNRIRSASFKQGMVGLVSMATSAALGGGIVMLLGLEKALAIWVLPLAIAHSTFSAISFLHHVHPGAPLLTKRPGGKVLAKTIAVTNHLLFSELFHFLTHDSHYHLAHHAEPSLPYWKLREKTEFILEMHGADVRSVPVSLRTLLRFAIACSKISHSDPITGHHRWLPLFQGDQS